MANENEMSVDPKNVQVGEFVILPKSTIRIKTDDGFKDFVVEDPIQARATKTITITVHAKDDLD